MRILSAWLLLPMSFLAGCATSRADTAPPTGMLFRSVTHADQTLAYAVYVPRTYNPATPLPAIVFLHGKGECGTDGQKMIAQGIGTHILWDAARWNCIVIMPQKPDAELQWEHYDGAVMAALAATEHDYAIDTDRIALTGLSQGGHGTWTLGAAHSDLWCALMPICGYADPADPAALAAKLRDIPVWCVHGEADDVVPVERSRVLVEALRAAGGNVRFTTYPDVKHDSWTRGYDEPEAPAWLSQPRRHRQPRIIARPALRDRRRAN